MTTHTTNYYDTFITVADDCPVNQAEIPPLKKQRSVANIEFDLLAGHPYQYTSDEILFSVFAEKQGLKKNELAEARSLFFSKGQPCFRASPLTKRYGWGVHFDREGKMALVDMDSEDYKKYKADKTISVVKAMRSSKKVKTT
jgi:hypothetical protein